MAKRDVTVAQGASGKSRTRVQKRAVRRDGWTAAKEKRFLELLADSANVSRSAEAVGMSKATAYRLRQRSAAFAAAWQEALDVGISQLETLMLDYALNGVEKPIIDKGRQTGTRREFSLPLVLTLLRAHRPEKYGGAARRGGEPATLPDTESEEAAREQVLSVLDDISGRIGDGD